MNRMMSVALACAAIVIGGASGASAQTKSVVVHQDSGVYYIRACGDAPAAATQARCNSEVVTNSSGVVLSSPSPQALTPANLRAAYGITTNGSSSTTVAIVDAYGYNNAEADLAVYRSTFGLPACTTANGCFKKVNQAGQQGNYPGQDLGWAGETALDLDMVSAMCPNCKILLVEATNPADANLSASVNTAVRLGANVVSNSYGGPETGSQPFEASYNHPGVAIVASSGDSGFGVQFPASSPHVIAVGGTTLKKSTAVTRGWTETAWSGAGSGCSTLYAKPSWQTDALCTMRMEADVSAVANPSTPVAIYAPTWSNNKGVFSGFWLGSGGTSVAAPIIAGIIGNQGGATTNYAGGIYAGWTANHAILNDVTSGSNGSCGSTYFCTAVVGYDGPTGLGTPTGLAPF
jgi:subtilase family serine protease